MTVHSDANYPPVPVAVQRFGGASLFDAKDTCLSSSGRRQLLYELRAETKRPVPGAALLAQGDTRSLSGWKD
jgi:hypothetical protein